MDETLEKIAAETTVEGAMYAARDEALACGAEATTFHLAAAHASQVGPEVFIAVHGHEGEWLSDYYTHAIRMHDPFPDHLMRTGGAMTYAQALPGMKLTEEQSDFVQHYHARHLDRTLAIAAYGPFDVDSFSAITFPRAFTSADNQLIQHLVALVEVTNRRVAQLLVTEKGTDFTLSGRETEVLTWMARSKSNGDIATILDVSDTTVDTYVRRIYTKLEVNDRISATVKGIRFGLIRF